MNFIENLRKYMILYSKVSGIQIDNQNIEDWYENYGIDYAEQYSEVSSLLEELLHMEVEDEGQVLGNHLQLCMRLNNLERTFGDAVAIMDTITSEKVRYRLNERYNQIFSLDLSEFNHYVERLNKYSPFIEEFHEYRYFSYEFFDQYEADCLQFAEYLQANEKTEDAKELVIDIIDILEHVLEDFTMHLLGSSWNPIKNFSEILEREEVTGIMVSDRIRTMTDKLLRAAL
ncbi:MAG: hypothetical protein Q4A10_07245 [Aerococcaceae bacterium]|nr:hypothetical protein [Aerococcaceae bacterium]